MSLLRDIQNAAVDDGVSISTLLRKCLMLAARLDNDELRSWATNELNGYDRRDDVPPYRVLNAPALGQVQNPYGQGADNVPIAPAILPEWGRRYATEVRLVQPIASLEQEAKRADSDLIFPWPGDLILHLQSAEHNPYRRGLRIVNAWQSVAPSRVYGLVDTVRSRVLDFALRLEKEAPAAGEADQPTLVEKAVVQRIYQTTINGQVVGNVSTGDHSVQTTGQIIINKGDLNALLEQLAKWGIPKGELDDLTTALRDDPAGNSLAEKPKTREWLSKILEKTYSGTIILAVGVGIDLIAQAIGQYLGVDKILPMAGF